MHQVFLQVDETAVRQCLPIVFWIPFLDFLLYEAAKTMACLSVRSVSQKE